MWVRQTRTFLSSLLCAGLIVIASTVTMAQVLPCRDNGDWHSCCDLHGVNEDRWCQGSACGDLVSGNEGIRQTVHASVGQLSHSPISATCSVILRTCDEEEGCIVVGGGELPCSGNEASGGECPAGKGDPQ